MQNVCLLSNMDLWDQKVTGQIHRIYISEAISWFIINSLQSERYFSCYCKSNNKLHWSICYCCHCCCCCFHYLWLCNVHWAEVCHFFVVYSNRFAHKFPNVPIRKKRKHMQCGQKRTNQSHGNCKTTKIYSNSIDCQCNCI